MDLVTKSLLGFISVRNRKTPGKRGLLLSRKFRKRNLYGSPTLLTSSGPLTTSVVSICLGEPCRFWSEPKSKADPGQSFSCPLRPDWRQDSQLTPRRLDPPFQRK